MTFLTLRAYFFPVYCWPTMYNWQKLSVMVDSSFVLAIKIELNTKHTNEWTENSGMFMVI